MLNLVAPHGLTPCCFLLGYNVLNLDTNTAYAVRFVVESTEDTGEEKKFFMLFYTGL